MSAALPSNFRSAVLKPMVKIKDQNDVLQYTFESEDVKAIEPVMSFNFETDLMDASENRYCYLSKDAGTNAIEYKVSKAGHGDAFHFNGTTTLYTTRPSPADPVASIHHWKLNNNLKNETGSNFLTVVGAKESYTDSIINRKSFNSNNDSSLKVSGESDFDFMNRTTAFSINFWFQLNSITGTDYLVTKKLDNTVGQIGVGVWRDSTDDFIWFVINNGTTNFIVKSTAAVVDNIWHHCVVTFDGGNDQNGMNMYLDDVQTTGTTVTMSGTTTNNHNLIIGGSASNSNFLNGAIADVRIYNVELTSAQAHALWMDDVSLTQSDSYSVAFWIYPPTGRLGGQVFSKGKQGSTGPHTRITLISAQKVRFACGADNTNRVRIESSLTADLDKWNHVVCTYDGSATAAGMKIYINGVLDPSPVVKEDAVGNAETGMPMTIGGHYDLASSQPSAGEKYDELRVWTQELTQAQVSAIYGNTSKNKIGAINKTTAATQDFKLRSFNLERGINDNYGTLVLSIVDNAGSLVDSTNPRYPCKIKREWPIQFFLGEDAFGLERWFYGKVKKAGVARPGPGRIEITLICIGWGIVLKDRVTRLVRNQDKQANGIDLDDTDTKTQISELIVDLFEDKDHYIDDNIEQINNIEVGVNSNGICDSCATTKLSNVNFSSSTFATAISTLASIANATWGIDANRKLILRDMASHDSGFLFSNDLDDLDTQTWAVGKLGYLTRAPAEWADDSSESYYNYLHGFGHFAPALDIEDGQTPDAADNLDTAWHAIPIIPKGDNIFKIAIRSIKTGTPQSDGNVQIWGGDVATGPDPNDVRRKIIFNKSKLQSLGTSTPATWLEVPLRPKLEVTPGEQLFIVFQKYGDASNTFSVNYKTGAAAIDDFWDSGDGVTWTSRTGQSAFRVYNAKRLVTTYENVDISTKTPEPKEKMIPIKADLEEPTVRELMIHAGAVLGKEHRLYSDIEINCPLHMPELASSCRVKDGKTGLNFTANIIGISIEADRDSGELGAEVMKLTLEDIHS